MNIDVLVPEIAFVGMTAFLIVLFACTLASRTAGQK